jgi:hypothetical protein
LEGEVKIYRFKDLMMHDVLQHPCGIIVDVGQTLSCSILVTAYKVSGKCPYVNYDHDYYGFDLVFLTPNFIEHKKYGYDYQIYVNDLTDKYAQIYGQ